MTSQVSSKTSHQEIPSPSSYKNICLIDDASTCLLAIASAVVDPFSTLIGATAAVFTRNPINPVRVITPARAAKDWNFRVLSLFRSGLFAAWLFCTDKEVSLLRPFTAMALGYAAVSALYRRTTYVAHKNADTAAQTT